MQQVNMTEDDMGKPEGINDSSDPELIVSWLFTGSLTGITFIVERKVKDDPWGVVATTPDLEVIDPIPGGGIYSYRVRACFQGSCSGYSDVVSIDY